MPVEKISGDERGAAAHHGWLQGNGFMLEEVQDEESRAVEPLSL